MKLVYFKDEDPGNVYLVLEELENSYILGLLEYPDIEMLMDYGINLKDEFAIQGVNMLKQNEQINKQ